MQGCGRGCGVGWGTGQTRKEVRTTKGSDPPEAEWQQGWLWACLSFFPAHFTNLFSDLLPYPPASAICLCRTGSTGLGTVGVSRGGGQGRS